MNTTSSRPNWWQLYLLLPLIVVLAWADTRLVVGETEHKVIEIGAVLFIGWLANCWISANQYRMMQQSSGIVKASLVKYEYTERSYSPTNDDYNLEKRQPLYAINDTTKKMQAHFYWYSKN